MLQDVDHVIGVGVVVPQLPLHPECAVEQRVELLRRPEPEPDVIQTGKRAQRGFRDVGRIVPQHPAVKGWMVDDERGGQQGSNARDRPSPWLEAR